MSQKLLYLSRADVEEVGILMSEIIAALESMFKEKGRGKVEMPPKPGIHTRKDAFIHAMAAHIPALNVAGLKWVAGYPENQKKNLPYVSGLLILNDPDTGFPVVLMDATWITAKRTGAATAVAAKYLARVDSSSAGIIACGVQGRSNLEALTCQFKLDKVKAYDVNHDNAVRFSQEMEELIGVEIEVVNSAKEAVVNLDMVVTSGPILQQPSPVIEANWLAEGSFASPVDFDSYWTPASLKQIDKLATDDIGQMNYYRELGYFKDTPEPFADLGKLSLGELPGRENDHQRTMSMNLGIAPDDMATAALIYKKAVEKNIGVWLEL